MKIAPHAVKAALLSAPLLSSGCFTFKGEAGYVFAPREEAPDAVLLTGHMDVLSSGHTHGNRLRNFDTDIGYQTIYGYGSAVRLKAGSEIFQIAGGFEGLIALNPEDNRHNDQGCVICPYARGGVHLLQFGVIQQEPDFGVGSPYLHTGLALCPSGDVACFTIGGVAEYDVRFTTENDAYFGLTIGAGL